MLVSLDVEVSEDLSMGIPDYCFWFYPPVFTVLKIVLFAFVASLSVLSLCKCAAAAGDMC